MTHKLQVWAGAALGAGAGAALAYFAFPSAPDAFDARDCGVADEGARDDTTNLAALLKSCPFVSGDAGLLSLLSDSLRLFVSIDAVLTSLFLEALERLVRLIAEVQGGQARPNIVADALLALVKAARQQRPSQAADLAPDFGAISQYLDDCVYNISQISGLNAFYRE